MPMPPERKDRLPSVQPISLAFVEGRSRQCKASLPGKEPQGQFIGRNMFTRRVIRVFKRFTRAHKTKRLNGQDLFFVLRCVGVLDAEDDVGAGAATGGLLQKVAALQ